MIFLYILCEQQALKLAKCSAAKSGLSFLQSFGYSRSVKIKLKMQL